MTDAEVAASSSPASPPPQVPVGSLGVHVGETVTLRGWLYNKRSSGKLHFLEVRDGFGLVQCVMSKADAGEETFARADTLQQEASLRVTGKVSAHPKRPGVFELHASGFELIAAPADAYP